MSSPLRTWGQRHWKPLDETFGRRLGAGDAQPWQWQCSKGLQGELTFGQGKTDTEQERTHWWFFAMVYRLVENSHWAKWELKLVDVQPFVRPDQSMTGLYFSWATWEHIVYLLVDSFYHVALLPIWHLLKSTLPEYRFRLHIISLGS